MVYDFDWAVGQVVDKKESKIADMGPEYIHVNLMSRKSDKFLSWPARKNIVNVLEEEILFKCQEPTDFGKTMTVRHTGRLAQLKLIPEEDRNRAEELLRKYQGRYGYVGTLLYIGTYLWYLVPTCRYLPVS